MVTYVNHTHARKPQVHDVIHYVTSPTQTYDRPTITKEEKRNKEGEE